MYVTVSLMIEVDASATLSQLESQIEEAGRAAMKEALKQAIQQDEAPRVADPFWGRGSAAQAAALPSMLPDVSLGGALFG